MAPLNEEQLEQIRSQRKFQIMMAALKVFAENGIRLTKINMIAAEAGISHGLLYHYFKSKEEVLYESLQWAISGSGELFQEIAEMQSGPVEKIKHLVKTAFTEGNSDVFRVIHHLRRTNHDVPEHIAALIERSSKEYITFLLPLFIEGQRTGDIVQTDPQELLEMFLTVITGLMMEGDLEWWGRDIDRKIDLLMRMITAR
ncbi:TetR family transcriptional regulator [Paenibacillus sp. 32O-W]|uniref:TetR/AcrR family transcriptional regulator n=1 Tax=Paenibacillus sp. 32O-W TaxID=1695218 RepID=UPI0007212A54|nr:TetR/AcrR family transcriptional regulator [Paenibacillus sp. 32O-W]ALS29085.1 TetR family transcriptional regulator [Paenibacillus sp. 32O-W]